MADIAMVRLMDFEGGGEGKKRDMRTATATVTASDDMGSRILHNLYTRVNTSVFLSSFAVATRAVGGIPRVVILLVGSVATLVLAFSLGSFTRDVWKQSSQLGSGVLFEMVTNMILFFVLLAAYMCMLAYA